ncbi:stromal processing peptidase, chloroplastic isoform X2 [Capsella rubella]|uniref:stromal processing peptidase, chloroplastic isoform X2 n=1 Tax=Capsella rubella TaxID=81985 RepID=UPI000CD59C36|nr:stromal processing peptidase, chloroplastic isoform X2 [Capsella rubella]
MASSSSSIFSGVKFSPILTPFNSGDSRRSRCVKDRNNKVRFNPSSPRLTPNRVRVEAQSLIPSNGLWAQRTTNRGGLKRSIGLGQGSAIFRKEATGISLSQGRNFCYTCKRTQSGIRRSLPSAFVDRTSFSLSRSRLTSSLRKSSQILNATVRPDEPHAAGTAWPDGIVAERQDIDLLPPEIDSAELEAFLGCELPSHPKLHRGQLKNGLRYLILPNKVPPNRFEAHMEVHVGSIDEEDDEQGIAHMIEHVAFLGSKKREKLLGTGARSNAYTDFHHTVFHIHSPTHTKDSEDDLFPSVLDALNEIAFHPKFLSSRVEKERRAILSELQMMNTIEYRVDCQLLQHLHSENKLGRRFPIGLEEQIKKWDVDKIRKFHERWYFPANATLYIVGDIDNIPQIVHNIEAVFGKTGLDNEATPTSSTPGAFGAMANFLVPKLPAGLGGTFSNERTNTADQSKMIKRERHAIRPPVEHNWSLPGTSVELKPPQIFKHELLQNFAINMFCKIPVSKVQTFGDLRNVLMKRIFLSALHFRINTRYKSSNPPFTSVELDHSDSGREGCTVTTLTVTAEPKNWQNAVKVAVQEVRRLKEFGVTRGELTRYMDALLKDSEHLAAMIDNVSSVDNLDFIMESDALGHTVMDQTQGHETLVGVAGTVTLEEVNTVGAKVLEFISDFGRSTAPLPAAIVACVPTKVHVDGAGESDFNITPGEIIDSIKSGLLAPIEAEPELEVPKELITQSQLEELTVERNPCFDPIPGSGLTKLHDKETGITQLRLSNGISVNYKISTTESRAGVMRLIVGGGRAAETSDSKGAVVVGVRTLSEGGRVGDFSREQVELFCVNHLINCSLESTEEFIAMEFRFTLRDNGMQAAFQLLHMVLERSVWLEDAFDRARQLYLSYFRSIPKSLERATAHKLMIAMLNGDERFVEPTPKSLQKLNLESVKDAVMSHFVGDNMEVSIVGDFSEEEIERCILDYLGTVKASHDSGKLPGSEPIVFRQPTAGLQFQQVFLKDTDERACAYIAGPAPNRWGFTVDGDDLFQSVSKLTVAHDGLSKSEEQLLEGGDRDLQRKLRAHPLFFGISMGLLAEIINSRLFTTVRDSLGLTYDVSFELNLFDRLNLGWYVISVTSTPGKVYKAVDACKSVLRGLHSNQIAPRELDRAKRTLLMRHEAELKSNAYWLNLLAHLQASSVPRKELSCIKELTSLYEAASIEDIYLAYNQLRVDEDSLYSCIGIAGAQAGEETTVLSEEEEPEDAFSGVVPVGRGSSMTTRPTT